MGLVIDTLVDLISKQVQSHHTVVWHDPESSYAAWVPDPLVDLLMQRWPDLVVQRFDPARGFFHLRHALETQWAAVRGGQVVIDRPRLVIYVAGVPQATARQALLEYEASSAVLGPAEPPERATAPEAVARRALSQIYPPDKAEDLVSHVAAASYSLAELDEITGNRVRDLAGPLARIYGTENPRDLALGFLTDPTRDQQVIARSATDHLFDLLRTSLGAQLQHLETLEDARRELERHVLVTELVAKLSHYLPADMQRLSVAANDADRDACVDLAELWRLRSDLAPSYVAASQRVEQLLGLDSIELSLEALAATESFAVLERQLMRQVQCKLAAGQHQELHALIARRQVCFWANQDQECAQGWRTLDLVEKLLSMAERIERHLSRGGASAGGLLDAYTKGENPWYKLDTWFRHLETVHQVPEAFGLRLDLQAAIRARYSEISHMLAERFTEAYAESGFSVPGYRSQREVFARYVAPHASEKRIAYVLVDALRYEMAVEMASEMSGPGATLHPDALLAAAPTITLVGMAALMPRADKSLSIVGTGTGLACRIGDRQVRTRQERIDYVAASWDGHTAACTLDELLLARSEASKKLREADLAVITSTEIDQLCESGQALLVRQTMQSILHNLRQACHLLAELEYDRIIVTADHGYLLVPELSTGRRIDAPGGDTVAFHRRCWVGRGGSGHAAILRRPLSDLGFDSSLELAVPKGLAVFKVAGGETAYFHGGLSLQEIVIPVLEWEPAVGRDAVPASAVAWELMPQARQVSTRVYTAKVVGSATELLPVEPRKVRLELLSQERVIACTIGASYGFEEGTGDVEMRPESGTAAGYEGNTIFLLVEAGVTEGLASLRLSDALTGRDLARVDSIPITILD